jgi:hypothetical protein
MTKDEQLQAATFLTLHTALWLCGVYRASRALRPFLATLFALAACTSCGLAMVFLTAWRFVR